MVAIINSSHSIHRILNYNENKVKEGVAECIGAQNYPFDPDQMSFNMKLNRFLKQMELNQNTKRNSVHISLNFDSSEKGMPNEKLIGIADTYMQKIGFGKQPYLVYRHDDAGHPHIHIVTTNIEHDGRRIDLHHLGIRMSEPARKAIEKEYGLVRAEDRKRIQQNILPVNPVTVKYGKNPSKQAIQNVLQYVIGNYKFASFPELNAILQQYNLKADRGQPDSRTFIKNGLLYRILDSAGNPVGVPIKASLFASKPTLKFLEQKFLKNKEKGLTQKRRVKNAIDTILASKNVTLDDLSKILDRQGIHIVLRTSENGLAYGITYVDHQTRCVFNGSALGKEYSAKQLMERCANTMIGQQTLAPHSGYEQADVKRHSPEGTTASTDKHHFPSADSLIDSLLQHENAAEYVTNQFKKGRKKKRKRNNPGNN
ncbi:relaxase/mobilization nuclease domain-containing protein [Sphingobacterium spiritivorum]|uniref:relaxase/mobilization nuclease domain-containing protein n=1 Tax=Sphingobacterium spiritivorum TaxID=258 RepID=UPI003DA66B00